MRSWRREPAAPPPGDPATMEEVRQAARAGEGGLPPGAHRHGGEVHLEDHAHPHVAAGDDGRPVIGIIGAGAVGTALGVALSRAGWQVGAVASRDAGRRERFRTLVPAARAFPEAAAILDECHLAILAVPDDAVAALARSLHLYSGQAIVHTSGLHDAGVLAPALAAGTSAGSFHPLVAFADLERALAALPGATVAIEGDDALLDLLDEMAVSLGTVPVRLAPGSKVAYHAAAVLAAGGLTALLDVIVAVSAPTGLDEAGALAVYGPLAAQALANARALGTAAALTGPAVRGDAGTIAAHVAAVAAAGEDPLAVYRALGLRQVAIAEARRGLAPGEAARLARRVHKVGLTRYDLHMQRSIAARYAARPTARFATAVPRAREPRLGLERHVRFRTGADRPTLLRRPEHGPVALLRAEWRAVTPARAHGSGLGLGGPHAPVRWAKLGVRAGERRSRAATAPWRG